MSTASDKPRIVLFNPSAYENSKYYGLPLPLLAIAALPHSKGWPIEIVVQDVHDDFEERILAACEGALLFGVTSLTGTMIGHGLNMSRKVRERFPNLPIVWGGTHPSIAPAQTCEHQLVDIVVAGQGEGTFMELIEALYDGRPLESVEGIFFKKGDAVVENPERAKVDIDTLPPMPFELLDVERFIELHSAAHLKGKRKGGRSITYFSSYGCPFSCSFCSEPMTSKRRWFAKNPERVVDEVEALVRRYRVNTVIFEDPIYFIDVRRVRKISELMLERGLDIQWAATSRLETIKKIDEETWDVLKRSGWTQVFIGIESASPTVLKAIGKRYSADDIVDATRILGEKGVQLVTTFIQGIPVTAPGRTFEEIQIEDMKLASQTIVRMIDANPWAAIGVVMYTPYPGSVSYHESIKHGFEPPETLEGWTTFNHYQNQLPWLLAEQQVFSDMSRINHAVMVKSGRKRVGKNRLARKAIFTTYGSLTRARYKHGYFKYPVEQRAFQKLVSRVLKRKAVREKEGFLI